MHLADAFNPKRLTVYSGYTFFSPYVCSMGIESSCVESLMGFLHIFKSWTSFNLRARLLERHAAAKVARRKGNAPV